MRCTYELKHGPPALEWETYRERVLHDWQALLDSAGSGDEKTIQRFLEEHPSLVPGAFGFPTSGHYPFPGAVISQPRLIGLTTRIPDFMWIVRDSECIQPLLVEIETPHKRWFTQRGRPSAAFTQAKNQLTEWRDWFDQNASKSQFFDYYRIPEHDRRWLAFKPFYVLVYGRRREFDQDPELNRKRAHQSRQDESLMTFDRLAPLEGAREMLCVTRKDDGYHALHLPATMRLSPTMTELRANIRDIPAALERNGWISEDRKEFLRERIPYWEGWERDDKGTFRGTGAWE